jgi:hypothetical protein
MTVTEIKAEIAQLNAQIQREPRHYAEALQLRQARRRREMLQAELLRMERLANLPETTRERLRRHFSAFQCLISDFVRTNPPRWRSASTKGCRTVAMRSTLMSS